MTDATRADSCGVDGGKNNSQPTVKNKKMDIVTSTFNS